MNTVLSSKLGIPDIPYISVIENEMQKEIKSTNKVKITFFFY